MHPTLLRRVRPGSFFERAIDERRARFPSEGDLVSRCINHELGTFLVDLLVRQDKMTMAHSMENRVPLLDHELVELAATIPPSMLVAPRGLTQLRTRSTKIALKEVARRHFSQDFVYRPKQAFGMPLLSVFGAPSFRPLMEDVVLPGIRKRHVFSHSGVTALWAEAQHDALAAEALWTCVAFEVWAKQFLDGNGLTS
jgi:asparagine synthase (glutamine-hydrolysing)